MRSISYFMVAILCWSAGMACGADLVVVVNRNSAIEHLSKDDVVNIFMGRYRQLPTGITAEPVDLALPQAEKARFYSLIVGKELSEIDSYWARLKFSGQRPRPRQSDSAEDLIEFISNSRGGIGYIDKRKLDKRVKVVLDLSP
jgi:hypothetical protein